MSFFKGFGKKQKQENFEKLIKQEQVKLYKVAYSYVKNEQDALDIVQEAIIKGYKAFDQLKNIEYFSTWMTRILINTAIDFLKRRKEVIPLELSWFNRGVDEEEKIVMGMDISTVFEKLKPEQKTIILLRFYYGYSIREIADFTGKPEGTVKSQLHRTLQFIKGKLENGGKSGGKAQGRY